MPLSDSLIDIHLKIGSLESFDIVVMQDVASGSTTSRGGSQTQQLAVNNRAIEQFKFLQIALLKTNTPLDNCLQNYSFSSTSNLEKQNSMSALISKAKLLSISSDNVTAETAVRRYINRSVC